MAAVRGKLQFRPTAKVKGKCFNCGIVGHFARDCRKQKKARSFEKKSDEHANAIYTSSEASEVDQHVVFWTTSNTSEEKSPEWYIRYRQYDIVREIIQNIYCSFYR